MTNRPKPIEFVVKALVAVLAIVAVGVAMVHVVAPYAAAELCDKKSLQSMADRSTGDEREYRLLELAACRAAEQGLSLADVLAKEIPKSEGASSTSTEAPAPAAPQVEYLRDRPVSEKVSVNAFGPSIALAPSNGGIAMGDMNVDQALAEADYRMSIDPALTAALEQSVTNGSYDPATLDARVTELASNPELHAQVRAQVLATLKASAPEIGTLTADQTFLTTAMLPGNYVRIFSYNPAAREGVVEVRVLKFVLNGEVKYLRLECGFQEFWVQPQAAPAPTMPSPSPGMSIDKEGTPEVKAPPAQPEKPETPTTDAPPPVTTPPTTTQPPPPVTTEPPPPVTTEPPPPTNTPKDPPKDGGDSGLNEDQGPGEYVEPTEVTQPPATYAPPATPTQEQTTAPTVPSTPDPTPTGTANTGDQTNNGQVTGGGDFG